MMNDFIKEYDKVITREECEFILGKLDFLLKGPKEKIDVEYSSHADVFVSQYASVDRYVDLSYIIKRIDNLLFNDYYGHEDIRSNIRNQFFCEATFFCMKKGEVIELHTDNEYNPYNGKRSNIAALLYLNEPRGGELCFPVQKKVIKPDFGKLAIFPTFFTHPHSVMPLIEGERYLIRFNYYIDESC